MDAPQLSEDELSALYNWVDEIPLSRPKKNITRDFADGMLVAEIVHHFLPSMVELHNYSIAHSLKQKLYNWNTLNTKVFKKMGFQLSSNDIDYVVNCKPDSVERVLKIVQVKIDNYITKKKFAANDSKMQQGDFQQQQQQQQQSNQMLNNYSPNQKVDPRLIFERDQSIQELRETIEILELKIKKLEQLVKLKDTKIATLQSKLNQAGIQ